VLGCLIEKQLTTPQQYPLTLNALTTAANQATNRDPVVELDDDGVLAAVDELRGDQLVRVVLPSHGRSVKRYRHVADEVFGLDSARTALVATLLLRGPQTVGELRARSERMVEFPSIGDVQDELAVLADHPDGLVRLLPRRPGQKEDRWHQILATPWTPDPSSTGPEPAEHAGSTASGWDEEESDTRAVPVLPSDPGRAGELDALRADLLALRAEVDQLRRELDTLREGLGG
jgi:uncharacterized protein